MGSVGPSQSMAGSESLAMPICQSCLRARPSCRVVSRVFSFPISPSTLAHSACVELGCFFAGTFGAWLFSVRVLWPRLLFAR